MTARLRAWTLSVAASMFVVLVVPPIRQVLEASMTAQMLIQIPLLVVIGWMLSEAIPSRLRVTLAEWNLGGITGGLIATVGMAYWMLPRALDASVMEPLVSIAKYLSIPLLVGLPLALSWPRMSFVVRGVILMEFIATLFRLGWLYLESPVRLCSNYLLNDQQRVGQAMLVVGGVLSAWSAWKLLWGRFESSP